MFVLEAITHAKKVNHLALPAIMDFTKEKESVKELYGLNNNETAAFGSQCLMARRFAEAGVRYIELTHGSWDHHLYAIKPNEMLLWKFRAMGKQPITSSAAIDNEGALYFGSYDHYLYAIDAKGGLKW